MTCRNFYACPLNLVTCWVKKFIIYQLRVSILLVIRTFSWASLLLSAVVSSADQKCDFLKLLKSLPNLFMGINRGLNSSSSKICTRRAKIKPKKKEKKNQEEKSTVLYRRKLIYSVAGLEITPLVLSYCTETETNGNKFSCFLSRL